MERILSINPSRILWCCADYGISTDELATSAGVSAISLARVLDGDDGLTFNQLEKIAEFFGRGALFFLEPDDVDETRVHTPQFRTLANQKPELTPKLKALIERVEKQRAIYLNLRDVLDEPSKGLFRPPEIPQDDPVEAARLARQWLRFPGTNNFDSYRAAVEARGVLVFRSNGYNGKWQIAKSSPVLGFSLYDRECPVIVVKKRKWETQQSFTLAHELGHLLIHKASSIDDDDDFQSAVGFESQANKFAGHLLVPDAFLDQIADSTRPTEPSEFDDWLARPRRLWGVSTEVILRRLLDSGRLRASLYRSYRNLRDEQAEEEEDGGARLYRHREPKTIFGDRFVRTVLDALSARQITLTRASHYLDSLKINDLHQLERHYESL